MYKRRHLAECTRSLSPEVLLLLQQTYNKLAANLEQRVLLLLVGFRV